MFTNNVGTGTNYPLFCHPSKKFLFTTNRKNALTAQNYGTSQNIHKLIIAWTDPKWYEAENNSSPSSRGKRERFHKKVVANS